MKITVYRQDGQRATLRDREGFERAGWRVEGKLREKGITLSSVGRMTAKLKEKLENAGWSVWEQGEKNPKAIKRSTIKVKKQAKAKAEKKAAAWFQDHRLVTKARILKRKLPDAFVEVGTIAAIEYESNKFDGEERLYRHDVTKKRKLYLSTDGSTLVVHPPFKITKRGIEG